MTLRLTSCRPAKRDLSQLPNETLNTIAAGRSKAIRAEKYNRLHDQLRREVGDRS